MANREAHEVWRVDVVSYAPFPFFKGMTLDNVYETKTLGPRDMNTKSQKIRSKDFFYYSSSEATLGHVILLLASATHNVVRRQHLHNTTNCLVNAL